MSIEPLVRELLNLPAETEWVEFKHDNADPTGIGEYISALANSATLHDKNKAYVVWGIDDKTHEILGTTFNPHKAKSNNTELETWLRKRLSDYANFWFYIEEINNRSIVLLEIDPAQVTTIQFESNSWIRVGSYKKKLKDFPALEAELWKKLNSAKFEEQPAKTDLTMRDAFKLLDYVSYFDLLGIEQPESQSQMLHYLKEDEVIRKQDNGLYTITNTGALLFGKKLSSFDRVWRKALRIIQYKGVNRIEGVREEILDRGYISGFEEMIRLIESILPSREELIGGITRETITAYPDTGIRELVANQLIHQDLAETGSGPMVEIFDGRIEFTNPGAPLVDINRFIDSPPKSRNEKMAALFRRAELSEERGSGWDKIELACGDYYLPAPKITEYPAATRVIMVAHKAYKDMTIEERLWTCYIHACYQQTESKHLTNASLRNRLDLPESSQAMTSRLIKKAVDKGLIKPFDPEASAKTKSYVPYWM
ncbi:MAG: putative DNA binding domain-containing protein [Coriobacteriia bacterium]|nr:putative DNA binding domain-containing protein [Coriobacteriia bacterium]